MEAVAMTATEKSLVTVTPKESMEEQTIQLQITPQQFGDIKIAVEAEPLPGEVRRTNNRVETIIRVRRGGIRVAYFDSARPEQKWIREINDSTRIQLDYRRILSGALASRNRIPEEFFQPGNYDAYIIGDVPATAFTPEQLNGILRACNQGAGLMMTGGHQNFGAGRIRANGAGSIVSGRASSAESTTDSTAADAASSRQSSRTMFCRLRRPIRIVRGGLSCRRCQERTC
jgi:hypothetical protein